MRNAVAACRTCLAQLPPAISGAGGHPATFRAACECVRFGLSDSDALALLHEFNARCKPRWTEKDLAHKLSDARRVVGYGVRIASPKPAVRVVWKIERKPLVASLSVVVAEAPPRKARSVQASEQTAVVLRPDQLPWLHVAGQILAGEFDGADASTVQSITIGLRSTRHPLCQQALDRINPTHRGRRARP